MRRWRPTRTADVAKNSLMPSSVSSPTSGEVNSQPATTTLRRHFWLKSNLGSNWHCNSQLACPERAFALDRMAVISHGNHGRALVIGSRAVSALFTKFGLVMGLFSFLVVLASLLVGSEVPPSVLWCTRLEAIWVFQSLHCIWRRSLPMFSPLSLRRILT